MDKLNKIFLILTIITILAIIITFVTMEPKPKEAWTTIFFSGYPQRVKALEPFYVNFTVESHENEVSNYSYNIEMEFYENQELIKTRAIASSSLMLNPGEKKNVSKVFEVDELYPHEIRIRLDLFKEGINETYRNLYLWIDLY